MPKKRTYKGFAKMMHHWVKPALKATTHVLTIGGVVVAATPVIRGTKAVASGQITNASEALLFDTTEKSNAASIAADPVGAISGTIASTGIPLVVGIALVWAGAQLRKRVGN